MSMQKSVPRPRPRLLVKSLVWVLALAALATAIIGVNELSRDTTRKTSRAVAVPLPKVSVTRLPLSDHPVRLTVLSRLRPKHRSAISSLAEGRIIALGDRFLVGADVRKGEVLAVIDPTFYTAQHAEAAHALAQSKLAREMARRDAQQAQLEWDLLDEQDRGSALPSALFLRQPQVEAARLAVEAASRNLEHTEAMLEAATIEAPFDATVVARKLSPGEFVNQGQVIAELVSNDEFEITAQLTERQWRRLDKQKLQQPLMVRDVATNGNWQARVRSFGRLLDKRTQMRSVFLTLRNEAPKDNLVGGQFVEVELPGRVFSDVLVVSESAYTRDAAIWTVDDKNRLHKHAVSLVASEDDRVIVESPLLVLDTYRVVINPQARFTVGTRVDPVEKDRDSLGARS